MSQHLKRFFVLEENIKGDDVVLEEGETHHARDVLRLKTGDEILLFDIKGNELKARIRDLSSQKLACRIVERVKRKTPEKLRISLAQSLPQKGRMEYIIEKGVELGLSSLIPVVSERTVVRPEKDKFAHTRERWSKIAVQASKQCQGTHPLIIRDLKSFDDITEEFKNHDLVALLYPSSRSTISINKLLDDLKKRITRSKKPWSVLVLIGPEGDFSEREVKLARKSGAKTVYLGHNILRTDTAAIVAIALLRYLT